MIYVNGRDQPGRRLRAAFGTLKLIGIDMRLDELPGTGSERPTIFRYAAHHLARNIFRDVARSSLGGVEGNDAHRVVKLPGQESVDDGLEAGLRFLGLAIGAAGFAKVVEHYANADVEIRNEAGG